MSKFICRARFCYGASCVLFVGPIDDIVSTGDSGAATATVGNCIGVWYYRTTVLLLPRICTTSSRYIFSRRAFSGFVLTHSLRSIGYGTAWLPHSTPMTLATIRRRLTLGWRKKNDRRNQNHYTLECRGNP